MVEKGHTIKEEVIKQKPTSKWVLWIVCGVIAAYIILMVIGFGIFRAITEHGNAAMNGVSGMMDRQSFGQHQRFSNEQSYNVQQSSSDGLTTTTTNTTYTQTQGVVTAVNSDNIVVAGGGRTQTIKTNSSTTYANGTKPVVNDTVVVVGKKDGDTITATQIAVNN